MSLSYRPEDAEQCLAEGEYQASLKHYEEKVSKAGNPMAVLTWEVYTTDDRPPSLVKDYIVLPDGTWKIKRLAQAMNRFADFKTGHFQPQDEVGTAVMLVLKVEKQDGFDDKNTVKAYKPLEATQQVKEPVGAGAASRATMGAAINTEARRRHAMAEKDVEPTFAPDDSTDDPPF